MKTVLITLFGVKGIVHHEIIPQGQVVNQAYYMELYVNRLDAAVSIKRPELRPNDCILHH